MKIEQMSEAEFLGWLREQIGKREFMYGKRFNFEEMQKELYDILFGEYRLTIEEVERYFLPFGQSGYLSPKCKFELMWFVLQKDGISNPDYLFESLECGEVITGEEVEHHYEMWSLEDRLILTEEEKIEFFLLCILEKMGCGVLELLQQIAEEGVLLGELCPSLYEGEPPEKRVAVFRDGKLVYLPFLGVESKEELIRIIQVTIQKENKGELTMMDPIWDCVRDDGTCITAVRPPAGANWGIRILYSAAGKERRRWYV